LGHIVEAEAGLGAHGAVSGHSNLGGRAGGRHDEVVGYEVELVLFSVVIRLDFKIITIVDLLIDIFIHFSCNFRFVSNPDM